ncbi:MAG: hypothetical protein ACF788_09710 [Novipirellula sp. JB048]
MPDYPDDYYDPSPPATPPPIDPCPDGTCCPSPAGPAPGSGGGSGGHSGGGPGGGCSEGKCLSASSSHPIRYATGMLELVATDFVSPGFGESWGHTRSYANRLFQNGALSSSDEVNGRNWFVATSPFLAH